MPNRVMINGTGYEVPAGIEEISIRKFIELRNLAERDYISLIKWAIPDLDLDMLTTKNERVERELSATIALVNQVLNEIHYFMISADRIKIPESVTLEGLEIKLVPGLLTSLPYWPYVQVKTIIQQEAKKEVFDPTDRIPEVLAHYLYSTVTRSKYNEEKAEAFIELVDLLPMTEAIQVGNFFFLRFRNLYLSRTSNFLTSLNLLRLRLRSKFLKSTGILIRLKH
jgi:hypothetical protein